MRLLRTLALLALLASPLPAAAWQGSLQQRVEAALSEAPAGTRFGLVVATEDGRELIAINPDGRFIPASNTKLLTTAAAYATLSGLDRPDEAGGAEVRLAPQRRGPPDVVLTGRGDARLSSAADCVSNCLAALADAVAARTRQVRDVIGDDSLFPDQRWSPGMSWNNIQTRYGTAISALTIDDNELTIRVAPGAVGAAPAIETLPYYRIVNRVVTVAEGETELAFARMPNSMDLYITGTIRAGSEPQILRVSIDDPAHFAASRLRALLEARGVRVAGTVRAEHRYPGEDRPAPAAQPPLARLTPPPLAADVVLINKVSQNLHAELLLRRVGLGSGDASIENGVTAVAAMLERAGVPRTAWDISDGSGMSTYNRMGPRATVALLRWVQTQSWGAAYRESLPVAGVDGTLANRFRGTLLERRLFAKTGSLNATNALSGYLVAASGQRLVFSMFANDVPGDVSATRYMDVALNLIAAAY